MTINNIFQYVIDNGYIGGIVIADDLEQAIAENVDLYITGELGHEQFHLAKENEISVIAGGHYNTETVGVSLVMEKLMQETNIQGVFIDAPTNM